LRHQIGYVPQDIELFYGTVKDNIVMGASYLEDSVVLRAAQLAGVHEFVNRHPLGFDMPIYERGEGLSGGQRRTIQGTFATLFERKNFFISYTPQFIAIVG